MTEFKTLNDVISQAPKASGQSQTTENLRYYNAFLTSFNIQLVHRFPDVTDLSTIDYNEIKSIAEFCAGVNVVAYEVWRELSQPSDQVTRQKMIARNRAA